MLSEAAAGSKFYSPLKIRMLLFSFKLTFYYQQKLYQYMTPRPRIAIK